MKKFFSVLDTNLVKIIPQSIQHGIVSNSAEKLGGKIEFYTMENTLTVKTNEVLLSKIETNPNIEGFIFLTIDQLFKNFSSGIKIVGQILSNKWEVHFAMENISVTTEAQLEEIIPLIWIVSFTNKRDLNKTYLLDIMKSFN